MPALLIIFALGCATSLGQKVIKLNPQEIVDAHNRVRRLERASNMQEMVWSDSLAREAEAEVRRCQKSDNVNSYDVRKSFDDFEFVGENRHVCVIGSPDFNCTNYNATEVIEKTWAQDERPSFDHRRGEKKCQVFRECGRYAQIVWADTCTVGCAMAECGNQMSPDHPKSVLFVCWYGPGGNRVGLTFFRSGPYVRRRKAFLAGRPCSQCPGNGRCRDGLCESQCAGKSLKTLIEGPRPRTSPARGQSGQTSGERPGSMEKADRQGRCVYGPWPRWGECSATCGWGQRQRLRPLLKGHPSSCPYTTQRVRCNVTPC